MRPMVEEQEAVEQQVIETSQEEVQSQSQQQPKEEVKESFQATNFKNLRESLEKTEKERDEALRKYRELESEKKKAFVADDDYLGIGEDDLVEGRHAKKIASDVKKLKEELDKYKKESTLTTVEARLKSQYSDFDQVVNEKNIEKLKAAHPEIAQTLSTSTDVYSTGATAYKVLKKFILEAEPAYDAEKAQADENLAKPTPVASIASRKGTTPLSQANAFADGKVSKELANQLYREMLEARRKI